MMSSISLFLLLVFSCANLVQNEQNVPSVPFIKILSTDCSFDYQNDFENYMIMIARGKHDCEHLVFDEKLTKYSKKMAIAYAQNGWVGGADLLKNAGPKQPWNVENYGELSRRVAANESLGDEFGIDPKEAVEYWYGNGDLGPISGYQWYGSEPTREQASKFAYFTQLIWRSTDRYGMSCVVALNQSDSTKHYYLVVNFNTPPYSECRFRQNMIPPKNSGNPEWEKLRHEAESLKPTEDCQKLRIGQNYCPFGFEERLLSNVNRMRDRSNAPKLEMSEPLRKYSQNYANWLTTQSENVTGNQPLSKYGGNIELIKYYRPDSTDSNHSVILDADNQFDSYIQEQYFRYEKTKSFDKEPGDDIKEECKDFTRAIWASSDKVGIGCAVQWLPERNQSRSIVIMNFDPPGNVEGGYTFNVRIF